MAKVFIEETTLSAIGDAIRNKTGKTELIDPALMSEEIASIEAGSGGDSGIPEEAFTITGSLAYRFAYGGWDWFLEQYGDKIKTVELTSLLSTFWNATKLTNIPFDLNVRDCASFSNCFNGMAKLSACPKIRGTIKVGSSTEMSDLITSCACIRDFEDLIEPSMLDDYSSFKVTSAYGALKVPIFKNCYSLRRIPSWWYKFKVNPESTAFPTYSYSIYYNAFQNNYALDEVTNMPVWRCQAAQNSNMFTSTWYYTSRAKSITFETNDGQPIVTQWKSQVIDLNLVGYGLSTANYVSHNSGITADKEVKDDATYQALKNDPDWFTTKIEYSRYNHDSAVETINSLPDTSAYLASAGGTNTIKFKKTVGSLTDGGAIENLTAEEIAVAAAKGWTVTLS